VQTVAPDVVRSMAIQEERLGNINVRMGTLEHSVETFQQRIDKRFDGIDASLKELTATNTVMNWVLGILRWGLTLSIPTLLGVWAMNKFKRKSATR
jgi:hypothetical protein